MDCLEVSKCENLPMSEIALLHKFITAEVRSGHISMYLARPPFPEHIVGGEKDARARHLQ